MGKAIRFGGWVLLLAVFTAQAELVYDFEDSMQGWQVVEGQFDNLHTDRAEFHHNQGPYNKEGKYFLSTLETKKGSPDDSFKGVVESPCFILTGPRISFLIGGGQHPETYFALCDAQGNEIKRAHGPSAQKMSRVQWDVPELVGQTLFLRLSDQHTGGWGHITLDHVRIQGKAEPGAKRLWRTTKGLFRNAPLNPRKEEEVRQILASLRASVEDLMARYPDEYPKGARFLAALDKLERNPEKADHLDALQREILTANPLLHRQPILYVQRAQYKKDHHNTATLFQTNEVNTHSFVGGGALKAIDFSQGGQVTTLLESKDGILRDPEISFDGKRILFSMRKNMQDNYHVYEMGIEGADLRQLTAATDVADIDPIYLPDGDIVFSSSREPKYCMCNQHIMANLFRMDRDGANIHQLGKSTLFEGHAALLPDGRILYDRWEYVDRNFGDAQGLWTVNPDGTNHAVYYGNNTWSPGGVIDARPIPGTEAIICILGSCHDRPWGALAVLDRRRAIDGREAIVRTWPANAADKVAAGLDQKDYGFDIFVQINPKYEDPYPLDESYYLCSRATGKGEEMGIYLVDRFGNEIQLHVDAPGCYDPMPLAPRPSPLTLTPKRHYDKRPGTFYVANVYEGTHMQGVEPGTVKSLRVVESPEKRFHTNPAWGGQGVQKPAMNWHNFTNKRILGTVPVDEDGSAYFETPSDTFLYFQLLDKDGMMVQSMRSGVMVQPGESLGCVGCHDNRKTAPVPLSHKMPLAAMRAPDKLEGWHGAPREFSFLRDTQPVLTQHCAPCHDYGKKAGETLLLAPDKTNTFNTAYNELWRKKYIASIGAGPAATQQPYTWGSHASRLIQQLQKGHHDIQLNPEEWDRLVTWIDLNAPYYPLYACAYPDNLAGRNPLTNEEMKRLGELIGLDFTKLANFGGNQGPQISFDRPALSPALQRIEKLGGETYREALAIIQVGKERLAAQPRADMAGFQPCETDRLKELKYAERARIETENRNALVQGIRRFDAGLME